MTVYELIQELARYDADAEVGIRIYAKEFEVDVKEYPNNVTIEKITIEEESYECNIENIVNNRYGRKVWLECDLHQ